MRWFDFKDRRPKIPPFKPADHFPKIEPKRIEPKEEPMIVEEAEGFDGSETIIQKVKKFWGL